jgi:hypothetical protein
VIVCNHDGMISFVKILHFRLEEEALPGPESALARPAFATKLAKVVKPLSFNIMGMSRTT